MKAIVLSLLVGILLAIFSSFLPLNGLEILEEISCGDPHGLPFAFSGGFRNVPPGARVPMCIEAVHGVPLMADIATWFVTSLAVIRLARNQFRF